MWSPAGGWYAQPGNWKANTAVMGLAIVGIVAATWSLSAEREQRDRMPEPGRFFPSRKSVAPIDPQAHSLTINFYSWSKQIIEHERQNSTKNES